MWVKKNFGSKTAFEDEWLTKMYFEYAKEIPMDEVAFQKWLSAKVQSRVDASDTKTSTLNSSATPSTNTAARRVKNWKLKGNEKTGLAMLDKNYIVAKVKDLP